MTARRITDVTPADTALRKAARSLLDLKADRVEACKTCPKPIWFTAFFDGTGNNYDKDGLGLKNLLVVKYSNIAKLAHFAHVRSTPRTQFQYIEGVGTPCHKEGVDDSGDSVDGALGMAAAIKGESRIRCMMRRLKEYVDKQMPFVNQINLAVFGFSRGATQARAFTRMLGEEMGDWNGHELLWKQPGANGKRPRIVVYFLGVFDTVSSTGFGGSRTETVVGEVGATLVTLPVPALRPVAEGVLHQVDQGGMRFGLTTWRSRPTCSDACTTSPARKCARSSRATRSARTTTCLPTASNASIRACIRTWAAGTGRRIRPTRRGAATNWRAFPCATCTSRPDRSLNGNGDTELAAVICDDAGAAPTDIGQGVKVVTRQFALNLRMTL